MNKVYFLAAGETCMTIFWLSLGLEERTVDSPGFSAEVTFSVCVCSTPLRFDRGRSPRPGSLVVCDALAHFPFALPVIRLLQHLPEIPSEVRSHHSCSWRIHYFSSLAHLQRFRALGLLCLSLCFVLSKASWLAASRDQLFIYRMSDFLLR